MSLFGHRYVSVRTQICLGSDTDMSTAGGAGPNSTHGTRAKGVGSRFRFRFRFRSGHCERVGVKGCCKGLL